MTTIEDFFGSIGRRRPKAAVPPYPHAQPVDGAEAASSGRARRFIVRVVLVLLLLMLVFAVRFIPESWNPFGENALFSSNAANGGSGNGAGAVGGSTSTEAPQASNGSDGAPGAQGQRGSDGSQGSAGPAGAIGKNGADGVDGADGADGATGATGATGPRGPVGSLGQANSDISACDDNIVVGLRSAWSPNSSDFRVSRVLLSDVSDSCAGLYLGFDLLDADGNSLAHIEVNSLSVSGGLVTLAATDFPSFAAVRSVDVARVALEIAS